MNASTPKHRGVVFGAAAIIALFGLATLGAVTAAGHPPGHRGFGPPDGQRCLPAHIQKQLPTYDVNKNGRLDREEHRAMRQAHRKANLATYDKNGDGILDGKERASLRHDRMVTHFEALDANGNAEVSKAEAAGSCTRIERRFDEVDSDGSGSITWTEFEKAAPMRHPRRGWGGKGRGWGGKAR